MALPMPWLTFLAAVGSASGLSSRHTSPEHIVGYTINLENFKNAQYTGAFTLGNQTLPVIYDTGSFEVLVLSTLCGACKEKIRYDAKKSGSFVGTDSMTQHFFGSGDVISKKGFETLRLGGIDSEYKAKEFAFWQIVQHNIEAWYNPDSIFAGIVGLGHGDYVPAGYQDKEKKKRQTLLTAVGVDSFGICLERGQQQQQQRPPGRLVFGAMHTAMFKGGAFQSMKVLGEHHWEVKMNKLKIGNLKGADAVCKNGCGVVIDSGTSLISAPPSAKPLLSQLLPMVKLDCSNMHELPVIEMELDGVHIELPPAAYVWKRSQIGEHSGEMIHVCQATFMMMDASSELGPMWILGMPFLRYYYTVFDRDANTIHISPSSPTCEPAPAGGFLGNRAGKMPGVSSFAVADYEPWPANVEDAIAPSWAHGNLTLVS